MNQQQSRGNHGGGHLYMLESEHLNWRYWWNHKAPSTNPYWKPLYLKAREVFLRHGWGAQGEWYVAPIPFVLEGAVIACQEPSGLVYAWSTHELGWLDPDSENVEVS